MRCHDLWLAKDNRFLNPKSSYERHAIPNPSRLDAARQIVDRQPPCDLMCWKVIHGWRLERRAQRLFPFFTGALQTLTVNTFWSLLKRPSRAVILSDTRFYDPWVSKK